MVYLVLSRGAWICGIGLIIGNLGAMALGRSLEALLFEVRPPDPMTHAAVSAVLLGVTLLASYLPARRGSNLDPIASLRFE